MQIIRCSGEAVPFLIKVVGLDLLAVFSTVTQILISICLHDAIVIVLWPDNSVGRETLRFMARVRTLSVLPM